MKHDKPTTQNAAPLPVVPLRIAAAVAAFGVAFLAAGTRGGGGAPFPFLWRDVARVYFVCALPLAGMLTIRKIGRPIAVYRQSSL